MRAGASFNGFFSFLADYPDELFNLVFPRLYGQPRNIVVFCERPQFFESNPLIRPRCINCVVTNRKIPDADALALGWYQRVAGRKDALVRLENLPVLGNIIL